MVGGPVDLILPGQIVIVVGGPVGIILAAAGVWGLTSLGRLVWSPVCESCIDVRPSDRY